MKRALPCGDYGIAAGGRLVASVERKSLADVVTSLTSGKLRYALAELAAVPRAAVVVEDRYSAIFKSGQIRPAQIADGLAELQVRWPNVPIVFCETRQLAEEWTYRFLAAAHIWAETEHPAIQRITQRPGEPGATDLDRAPGEPQPPTAEDSCLGPRQRPDRLRPRQAPPQRVDGMANRPPRMIGVLRQPPPQTLLQSVTSHTCAVSADMVGGQAAIVIASAVPELDDMRVVSYAACRRCRSRSAHPCASRHWRARCVDSEATAAGCQAAVVNSSSPPR